MGPRWFKGKVTLNFVVYYCLLLLLQKLRTEYFKHHFWISVIHTYSGMRNCFSFKFPYSAGLIISVDPDV
jgi:hypothetical protein